MAKSIEAPPKVRLAGTSTPGAEMYNYYQLISLLSSLYVKALDRGDDEFYSGAWDACSGSVLEQLGEAYRCWGQVQTEASAGRGLAPDAVQIRRTVSLARRMAVLERYLNEWTPIKRWARLLRLAEVLVMRVGAKVASQNPYLQTNVTCMNLMVAARLRLLSDIESESRREDNELKCNFAQPIAL